MCVWDEEVTEINYEEEAERRRNGGKENVLYRRRGHWCVSEECLQSKVVSNYQIEKLNF